MHIVNHPLCTATIGAPSDMPDNCAALPVHYESTPDGVFASSFWQPDANELANIINGGCVVLSVRAIGRQHPVVALTACSNPDNHKGRLIGTILVEDGCWIANSSFDLSGLADGTCNVFAIHADSTGEYTMRHEAECTPTDADRFQLLMRAFDNPKGPEAVALNNVCEADKPGDVSPSAYARNRIDTIIAALKGK